MKIGLAVTFVLAVTVAPLAAQDMRDAAEDALDQVTPVTDGFSPARVREVVVPFAGTDTKETRLEPEDFDRAILDVQTGRGQDGRALQSTIDSFSLRPEIDLGPDPLGLADDAVENAGTGLGGLFTADGGTCEAIFQDGTYDGLRFCNQILQRQIDTCEVWRDITVDREDFWACEIAERDYTRTCVRDVNWTCSGLTGPACRKNRVRANRPFTWNADGTRAEFNLGQTFTGTICTIQSETFEITSYVGFQAFMMRVASWRFAGIAQLRVNGNVIFTTGTQSRGTLNVRTVASGGKDGIPVGTPVVHAGNTPIDICEWEPDYSNRYDIDLFPHVTFPTPGPSKYRANGTPFIPMGENRKIIITVARAAYKHRPTRLRLEMRGSCCSAITATSGSKC